MDVMGTMGIDGFGLPLHNAIIAPYITAYGTEEQKRRWLPKICSGEIVTAIAMISFVSAFYFASVADVTFIYGAFPITTLLLSAWLSLLLCPPILSCRSLCPAFRRCLGSALRLCL